MDQKELIAEYKKQGNFDSKRKELFDAFVSDKTRQMELSQFINQLVKLKISKDPDLFGKNRGKLSALIQTELVKRHVEKEKDKFKLSTDNTTITPDLTALSEIELLDHINSLLDSFAESIKNNEEIQQEMITQLELCKQN